MPDPISEGWVVALAVAFLPILYTVAKSVANVWRKPYLERDDENKLLKTEAVNRTNALTEAKIRIMFLETRLEYCESELESWRNGKRVIGERGLP